MFYEIKPFQKIKLEDIVQYSIYPLSNGDYSDYHRKQLSIRFRGMDDMVSFSFSTEEECRRAYDKLDATLSTFHSNLKMIMD